MKILITEHAKKRLKDYRQDKIQLEDVINAAYKIPGTIKTATRIRGFLSKSGRLFDLVVKDTPTGRIIITIIGKK